MASENNGLGQQIRHHKVNDKFAFYQNGSCLKFESFELGKAVIFVRIKLRRLGCDIVLY